VKVVIQRVTEAKVLVKEKLISEIGSGMVILLGVKKGDTEKEARALADRCVRIRIFEDQRGKFNLSLKDIKGEALVVSQFTLLADTSHGRRPSFTDAEEPEKAKQLYEFFISTLNELGIPTRGGIFAEHMKVFLENNGPVTIVMEA
jgi:D-tyrosyl-tRNA(Tyr) deacylase